MRRSMWDHILFAQFKVHSESRGVRRTSVASLVQGCVLQMPSLAHPTSATPNHHSRLPCDTRQRQEPKPPSAAQTLSGQGRGILIQHTRARPEIGMRVTMLASVL